MEAKKKGNVSRHLGVAKMKRTRMTCCSLRLFSGCHTDEKMYMPINFILFIARLRRTIEGRSQLQRFGDMYRTNSTVQRCFTVGTPYERICSIHLQRIGRFGAQRSFIPQLSRFRTGEELSEQERYLLDFVWNSFSVDDHEPGRRSF